MSDDPYEIVNTFYFDPGFLSPTERADMERGGAWAYYINGGGGEPRYFDYETYIRNVERER